MTTATIYDEQRKLSAPLKPVRWRHDDYAPLSWRYAEAAQRRAG